MKKIKYISGQIINGTKFLQEISPCIDPKTGRQTRMAVFECKYCGKEYTTSINSVKLKRTVSCGCYRKNETKKRVTKHGLTHHPLYQIWLGMKTKCYNTNEQRYKNYGAKGIRVCNQWKNNFKEFYNYAITHGWTKGLQIHRIDTKGNYTPDNCQFVNTYTYQWNKKNIKMDLIKKDNGKYKVRNKKTKHYVTPKPLSYIDALKYHKLWNRNNSNNYEIVSI